MKKLLLVLCALSFLVGACNDSREPRPSANFNLRAYADRDMAMEAFNIHRVTCPTMDCLPFAGALWSFTPPTAADPQAYVAACSMTLVAPDLVMTANHCLPEDLRVRGAGCGGRINLSFPYTSTVSGEFFNCEQIVDFSEGDPLAEESAVLDWALIKLSGTSMHSPATVNTQGIANNQNLFLSPSYFNASLYGEIKQITCRSNQDGWLAMYLHPLSAFVGVSDCSGDIVAGNSGSGLFSEAGELVGVMDIGSTGEFQFAENQGAVTNLVCIPYYNSSLSSFCYADVDFHNEAQTDDLELLKMYVSANQDQFYFLAPADEYPSPALPVYARSGSYGVTVTAMDFAASSAQFNNIDERKNYFFQQFSEFSFQESIWCIDAHAPDSWEMSLPTYNIKMAEIDPLSLIAKIPVIRTPVSFQFTKSGDKFQGLIAPVTLSDSESALLQNLLANEKTCLEALDPAKPKDVSCENWALRMTQIYALPADRATALFTNMLLNRVKANSITVETPLCP